jgi:rhodanese-related sulfurtransferase
LAFFLSLLAAPAFAGGGVISADEGFARAQAGELTIIDVRSPAEWRQTGVATGARRATVHDPRGLAGFLAEVEAIVGEDRNKPIAMICARGWRSAAATAFLREQGFTNVFDIGEGMLGRDGKPGWIARSLPVEPCERC